MKMIVQTLGVVAAIFGLRSGMNVAAAHAEDRPDIIRFVRGDPEMGSAVREAIGALDAFLALAASAPSVASDFSLKVGLPINEKDVEFVWVRPFKRDGADFVGRLVNTPRGYPGLRYGQPIGFARDNIVDFAYREAGKLKGHYTTCVLLKRMSNTERAALNRKPNRLRAIANRHRRQLWKSSILST